jgi:hypothetical protein
VEKVLPEVVHTDGEGYKAVAYQNVTALLVEAMKQQQSQIDALRATVEQLRAQIGSGSGQAPADAPANTTGAKGGQPTLGFNADADAPLGGSR